MAHMCRLVQAAVLWVLEGEQLSERHKCGLAAGTVWMKAFCLVHSLVRLLVLLMDVLQIWLGYIMKACTYTKDFFE